MLGDNNFIRPLFSNMEGFRARRGDTEPTHILVTSYKPDMFLYDKARQIATAL